MLTQLKRICFIGFLAVLSSASNDALSNEQPSLFEQFNLEQAWPEKHRLATDILSNPDVPNLQRITIYSDLAELAFTQSDLANALKYFKLLETNSTLKDQPKLFFRAIKMQGVVLYYQGLVQQAVVDYSRALNIAIALKSPIKQANLLSNIGLAYFDMYNMELALDYYQQAKVIYEKEGSAQDKADILHNIAGIYIRLSRYESALEMYREVLKVFQELGDEDGVAQAYGNMGVAYTESRQYQLALHYNQLALRYYQSVNNAFQLSTKHTNLATINLKLNKFDVAFYHANAGQQFAIEADNKSLLAAALHVLSIVQFVQGDTQSAKQTSEHSITLAKEYNNGMRIKDGLGIEALINASLGDYEKALNLHQQYVDYQRSVNTEEASKAVSQFQIQFESNQLNQEIKQLKQQQYLQELQIAKRSQLTFLLVIVAILILITVIAVYKRRTEKQAKLKLSEQVEQRTKELQSVAQELREANEVKSQFLANISHEIRTPLTAILAQTDDLINGLYKPEQLQDELRVIQRQSEHLKSLINDVLDLSKIEANRLELNISCFDVVKLINDIHAMFSPQTKAKGLSLVLDCQLEKSYFTRLDLTRVKQILINLCANAIKFTHKGQVTIGVSKTEQGLLFSIKDTGIGMSSSQLKLIFECFSQADNSISRRFGGTGLGLSLSQQLAAMMGGYISVQSEFKKGSEFSFYLPCIQVEEQVCHDDQQAKSDERHRLLSGKVVLAEDHSDNRKLISRYLHSLGLEVIAVENGEQAVEQSLKLYPDLVLLDIQMPVMDGISAFELLKQCGYEQPILALTANAMSHEIDHYLSLGFSDYLAKPIDKESFYTVLAKYLNAASTEVSTEQIHVDMSDLVTSFQQSLAEESELIKLHFKDADYQALQKDSHRVLGAAQMFEFKDIALAAKALDDELLQPQINTQRLTTLVNNLQALFKKYE
ncbi:MAG: tetratricopeptide repeat protein [Pseudoalteromonas sp.]|nr:tetratricopeptide repeat protein [Pseudoalteromonas sp.]